MLSRHAIHKEIFEDSMEPLRRIMGVHIKIHSEQQIPEMGKFAVDSVVIITKGSVKHMFMIEFQNTCREHPQILTHKFLHHIKEHQADKNYLWCVRITKNTPYPLSLKLVIIRSWMIFALRNTDHTPFVSCWMFFNDIHNPLKQKDEKQSIPLSEFLRRPIHVGASPKGHASDWEFCCDIFEMNQNSSKIESTCIQRVKDTKRFALGNVKCPVKCIVCDRS